ncbi:hypothetical protein H920_10292 [Fukomys damarensis]|uniref:Basic leucine zipper transcriptional factor ATF-like 2 n=1 Tax=Fukomys damarensis TaxID=885580 RepID=A0A091E024_FUKDA|nr:hypothetical protein H920_10292 [Fukomys damarensis]
MHLCQGDALLAGTDPKECQKQLKKKQKNRAAAQRSRQKHTDRADALHQQHESLEKHNQALRKEIQGLKAELAQWSQTLHLHEHLCPRVCTPGLAPEPPDCWGSFSQFRSRKSTSNEQPTAARRLPCTVTKSCRFVNFYCVPGYHSEAMSLKPFTYPFPETRFLHAGPSVYKFKIRYGDSIRGEEIANKEVIIQELEHHSPDKSKWERVSHLKFKHEEVVLIPYPFVFTLYVEMKWLHENLSLVAQIHPNHKQEPMCFPLANFRDQKDKTSVLDAKLMLKVASGRVVAEKKAAEAVMKKRKLNEEHRSPDGAGQPSNIHGLLPSPQGQDGVFQPKTQHEEATYGNQEDSKCGHNLPGAIVPPLQQNNSPPPKELGIRSVFGFLSAFPSWYSVLVASSYRHNITSISQCCTIRGLKKMKVQLQCVGNRSGELEVFTARACQCDMCRLSRY